MTRTTHALLSVALAVALAAGCGSASGSAGAGPEVTELRYQGSVGAVTFPELAQDLGYLGNITLKWVGNTISGPQDIQSVATGQTDFGGAFNGAIIKLVGAGAPIKAVIGYYGSDADSYIGYYVADGSTIKGPRDLIGKKVGVNTLGAHLEAALKEYLRRGGLTPQEIEKVQLVVVPPVNTEQALRQGQIDVAALSGVLRDKALERGGIHPLFKDVDLFGSFTAGSVVLTKRFIERNPATTRRFVEAFAKAIDWTQTHSRDEVIARYKQIIARRHRNEDATTVGFWKSSGVHGKGGLIAPREFQTWIDWLQREGEIKPGQVRLSDLYTNAFNPFGTGGAA
ncbi:ABC transporter substrate-binding protein [Microbispora sp. CA-135349]|uniref:ABC transporter substrate-binding protein n=1 Tax=Microbispora sp. CA-135349 TaxID=3239953 RepID=UPI003D93053C